MTVLLGLVDAGINCRGDGTHQFDTHRQSPIHFESHPIEACTGNDSRSQCGGVTTVPDRAIKILSRSLHADVGGSHSDLAAQHRTSCRSTSSSEPPRRSWRPGYVALIDAGVMVRAYYLCSYSTATA